MQNDSNGFPVPAFVRFESVDPTKNRARFYTLQLTSTLWGEVGLISSRGRIGTTGRSQVSVFDSGRDASEALGGAISRRLRRGYVLTRWMAAG